MRIRTGAHGFFFAAIALGLGAAGCEPERPPPCDLAEYVTPLTGPDTRDCGEWDGGLAAEAAGYDCVLDALDAGQPFMMRVDYLRKPGFEEPDFAPYAEADLYVGDPDGGLWNVIYDSSVGGRVLLYRCNSISVRDSCEPTSSCRVIDCDNQGMNEVCNNHYAYSPHPN